MEWAVCNHLSVADFASATIVIDYSRFGLFIIWRFMAFDHYSCLAFFMQLELFYICRNPVCETSI